MNPKNIIVISGPSGSGKSTLIGKLTKIHPEIVFSTSHTTRSIRESETDGIDYHFVNVDQFKEMIDRHEFVEWACVYGNYYGTSYSEIERKTCGNDCNILVLDIDVQGARNIRVKYPEAAFILIAPPSMAELRRRLLARENKLDSHIEKRLQIATDELKQYALYDYIIVNDRLEDAFLNLNAVYVALQNTVTRREAFMKECLLSSETDR